MSQTSEKKLLLTVKRSISDTGAWSWYKSEIIRQPTLWLERIRKASRKNSRRIQDDK